MADKDGPRFQHHLRVSVKRMESKTSPQLIRLNRYLAQSGLCSRREADRWIAEGRVKVNGKIVTELGVQVDGAIDVVVAAGEVLRPSLALTYIMLNKPAGYVTTASDEKGRLTVFHLVKTPVRVFSVGRLDRDSEGLLLLTNDGDLSYRLTHPRFKVRKTYRVALKEALDERAARALQRGVRIPEVRLPVSGELRFPNAEDRRFCEMTIMEGRNRQVRKMFAAVGFPVKRLQRIQIGPLRLGKLGVGEWRYLEQREVKLLNQATSGRDGNSQ